MRPLAFGLTLLALTLAAASVRAAPTTAALPPEVRRVLFLGDSITYGGFYTACVEAYFLTRHPDRRIEFINAGLSSETVSGLSEEGHAGGAFPRPDLHERLPRVLDAVQPDLVFACYGMNDGIYLPLAESRLAAFQQGLRRLREAVAARGARIVHATPPVYVDVKGTSPTYNDVLARYSAWLCERRADGWRVIDVHGALARELTARRQREPAFTFARDGVHPGEEGHWIIAREILRDLGAADLAPDAGIEALHAGQPRGGEILALVRTRMELRRDAWLTATGHTRPKTKAGLPLEEATRRGDEIGRQLDALLAR